MPSDPGAGGGDRPPPTFTLHRGAEGRFRIIEDAGGRRLEASIAGDGWSVHGDGSRRWRLERGTGLGFVLWREDGVAETEAGRTSHGGERTGGCGATSVLLADGRLFCIRASLGSGRVRLVGWDEPGEYWTAWRGERGWKLAPSLAGRELGFVEEILLLLSAEVLEAEEEG